MMKRQRARFEASSRSHLTSFVLVVAVVFFISFVCTSFRPLTVYDSRRPSAYSLSTRFGLKHATLSA